MGRKRKRQEEEQRTVYFLESLQNRQIPLLPLDARWHELFPDFRKTSRIKALEKRLNKLIQKQGQTNNDLKEYEKAKKVLMKNIVDNMTDGHEVDSPIRSMKQDRNQKLLAQLYAYSACHPVCTDGYGSGRNLVGSLHHHGCQRVNSFELVHYY